MRLHGRQTGVGHGPLSVQQDIGTGFDNRLPVNGIHGADRTDMVFDNHGHRAFNLQANKLISLSPISADRGDDLCRDDVEQRKA